MSGWNDAVVIKLFGRLNYAAGIGDQFYAGDHADLTRLTIQVKSGFTTKTIQRH